MITKVKIVLIAGLVLLVTGCPEAPVQALADATDALGRAGLAEDCAPEEYRAAERLLAQAEEASAAGDYDRALTLAQAAEEQAERARLTAQANADDCEALNSDLMDVRDTDNEEDLTAIMGDYELSPVYFGYDGSQLDAPARQLLEAHARFLGNNTLNIVVEGHCDHHGTDQYNLALGDRRARSVSTQLITLGVPSSRLSTISYGEFRPASYGDTSLNRRAEFRVRGQ